MFCGTYEGKRVLVTGHTGFKGSWLSQWLLRLGADVAGYSLYIPSQPSNFEVLHLADHIRHYEGDIRNLDTLLQVFSDFQPEIVFHLAAQPIVRYSYDEPKLTFDTNLGGTVNVLEAIRETPSIRAAVIITSDKCYENVEWEYGYREHDQLGGKDPYSASKACAEIAFSAYWRSFFENGDVRMATARAGNVIGGGDWAKDRIVPDCIRAWVDKKTPVIRNPVSTRPWQHVLEPLGGYLWLGAKLYEGHESGLAGEAFNFGPQAQVNQPVSRLVDEMITTWKGNHWENGAGGGAGTPEAGLLKLCCDKALHRLGWSAALSFEETVRLTSEWYQEYYSGAMDMSAFTDRQIDAYESQAARKAAIWAIS